jgi:hypothetical protein
MNDKDDEMAGKEYINNLEECVVAAAAASAASFPLLGRARNGLLHKRVDVRGR